MRCMRANCSFLATLLLVVCGGPAVANQVLGQAAWRARLLAEAPDEGKKLEAAVARFQGNIETTRVKYRIVGSKSAETTTIGSRGRYLLNDRVGGALLVTGGLPDSDSGGGAYGFNDQYDFELGRSGGQSQFNIQAYVPHNSSSGSPTALNRLWNSENLESLLAAEDLGGVKLSEILDGSSGKLHSVNATVIDGRTVLRIEFGRKFPSVEKEYPGSAVIDASHHWAVLSSDQRFDWGSIRRRVKYHRDVEECAFPSEIVREDVDRNGRVATKVITRLDKPEPCNAAAADFTLEAFNLEAPRGDGGRRRVAFLVTTAAILLIAGVWFTIRSYKHRQRAA